jgi:zinc protease
MLFRRLVLISFLAASPTLAQEQLDTTLPIDPKIKVGTLANGLRYYIRQNKHPENRAELRLVVNAGSILEADDQLGFAHFIEHTAFNGTAHFAKNDLVKYLQSIGVRFGADLNAYTGFEETVYILPIPTDTARIIDQAFTILEDWAHGQLFDSAEVVSERGIVLEEWRGSRGAGDRMLQQWLPIAFKNSLYAKRLPIGTAQSISTATSARLKSYYERWYRPDLMAVVAVGDFDPTDIEAHIRRHFSGLRRDSNAPSRARPTVPGNAAPLVAIAGDKEATGTTVALYFKHPRTRATTVADYRRDLVTRLHLTMLNDRLDEIAQKPDAPYLAAAADKGGLFARALLPFSLSARVKEGGAERALETLLVEVRRVEQFGFLQSELDRARADMLRGYEQAYAERDKTPSRTLAAEFIRNFLEDEPIPGITYEYSIAHHHLPSVTVQEVNALAAKWITAENRIVLVQGSARNGAPLATETGVLNALARAGSTPVVAYTENISREALIAALPAAGGITRSRRIPGVGVTEWTLSNGARVLVKPTDFKADEILFTAYSPGGTSLASDPDYVSAALASQIVGLSGIGQFSRVDLGKKLAGKAARVAASIGDRTEQLNGSAAPKDLETMLQLAHLQFTGARLDTSAFAAFRANAASTLASRGASPEAVFADTIQVTMSQGDFRARPMTPAVFAEAVPEKSIAFFRERFADAGDFTFVFVGNVDTVALKPLVERYLASLPFLPRTDSAHDTGAGAPKGVIEKTVRRGAEAKANTVIAFTGACDYTPQTRFAMRALIDAFQLRLVETLREKLGGTYSPAVGGSCSSAPSEEYRIEVRFGSSPENVEPLTQAVFALIDTLKAVGPTKADVDRVKEQIIRGREVELKQNSYWLGNIAARDQAGEDLAGFLKPYDAMVRSLTAEQILLAARSYLSAENRARFVLLPEASMQ